MDKYFDEVFEKQFKLKSMDNIRAEVVKKSTCENGKTITTFRLKYPRYIHSEVLTHSLFVRNSASSRAIPVSGLIRQVCDNPVIPLEFGKNKPGMWADELLDEKVEDEALQTWINASCDAVIHARQFEMLGVHKQVANRVLEPFMWMNTIVTATEWENFYFLRRKTEDYKEAQPEIAQLAEKMWEADQKVTATFLQPYQWHVPFVDLDSERNIYSIDDQVISEEDALKVSASVCAQVSYRKEDKSVEKAHKIWEKLVGVSRVHASPFAHQAKPISTKYYTSVNMDYNLWKNEPGITHRDKKDQLWSAQFNGWIMHRKLIPNEAIW